MAFDQETLNRIFERTDGNCHLCRKKLAFSNYGRAGARGAWEVEHSKARVRGGTDHLNNLYAAHIRCNRIKSDGHTKTARAVHGYRAAPLSKAAKQRNGIEGGVLGAALGFLLVPPQLKIVAMLLGAVVGAGLGSESEPD